eukprot:270078-Amphidinium_carterae.1
MAANSDFTVINGHTVEDTMSTMQPTMQQLRLKASSRAVPSTMEPTMWVTPTVSHNPTSPPEDRPTSHNGTTRTGPSSTTPMDTGTDAEDSGDVTMRAQSISSGSSSQCTVVTVMDIESMM